jgi:hypothetical protein
MKRFSVFTGVVIIGVLSAMVGCGNEDNTFKNETTPIFQTQNPIIPTGSTSTTTSTSR